MCILENIPNKYSFFRSGNIPLNTSDKVEAMFNLAISDGFGLTRRDVTTFNFQCGNESNVTDVYLANDDGSMWGMSTSGLRDNVNFTGKYIKADDIPIAPKYSHLGNVTFEEQQNHLNNFLYYFQFLQENNFLFLLCFGLLSFL